MIKKRRMKKYTKIISSNLPGRNKASSNDSIRFVAPTTIIPSEDSTPSISFNSVDKILS